MVFLYLANKNSEKELSNFTAAVTLAAKNVNEANAEMQARLEEAQALRESGTAEQGAGIRSQEAQDFAAEAEKKAAERQTLEENKSQVERDDIQEKMRKAQQAGNQEEFDRLAKQLQEMGAITSSETAADLGREQAALDKIDELKAEGKM